MILDWPSTLPRPERDSWQAQRQDGRRGRRPDAGPPSWRRRLSNPGRVVTMSLLLSRAQKAVFDNFYDVDCAGGVSLFRMPDPSTDGWPVLSSGGVPILTGDGAPLLLAAVWLCAWGDTPPVETILGLQFRLSFPIVVMP